MSGSASMQPHKIKRSRRKQYRITFKGHMRQHFGRKTMDGKYGANHARKMGWAWTG